MKITGSQLTTVLTVMKGFETKNQIVTMQVEDGTLNILGRKDGSQIKIKSIKTEEKDTEPVSFYIKEILHKIDKQKPEEFDLKINKKKITSKVKGVSFATNILAEEVNIEMEEDKGEGSKVFITKEIMDSLMQALSYTSKDQKKPILLGVNLKIKDGKIKIVATDSFKMYYYETETETKEEINVTLLQDTVNTLYNIHEVLKGRTFPVIINEKHLLIVGKNLYYKTVLYEGDYPDVERIIKQQEKAESNIELKMNDEDIKKVKVIENKDPYLHIIKEGKKVTFKTKSETNVNEFEIEIENENEEKIEKGLNYSAFINAISTINNFEVRGNVFIFKTDKTTILIMGIR